MDNKKWVSYVSKLIREKSLTPKEAVAYVRRMRALEQKMGRRN